MRYLSSQNTSRPVERHVERAVLASLIGSEHFSLQVHTLAPEVLAGPSHIKRIAGKDIFPIHKDFAFRRTEFCVLGI